MENVETEPQETPAEGQDAVLAVTEAILMTLSSLLPLVPLQVNQHDVQAIRNVQQLQEGMNRLAHIAMALGSTSIVPAEPAPGAGSGIIVPK